MTTKPFAPLLSATAKSLEELPRPCLVSPKLDGIRVVIHPELGPVTRKLKPVPNAKVREYLNRPELVGLDGEVIWGPANAPDVMRRTTTGTMTKDGPDLHENGAFTFYVFDDFRRPDQSFEIRFERARQRIESLRKEDPTRYFLVQTVDHTCVEQLSELIDIESAFVASGYEGMMVRGLHGRYKYGRATNNEGILYKVKRFEDAEAIIVDFEELQHNHNEAQRDNLGRTKRSSAAEGKVAGDTLGALVCRAEGFEETFNVGSGFDAATKDDIWRRRDELRGATITFKYMPHGVKDRPRHAVFKGFRRD